MTSRPKGRSERFFPTLGNHAVAMADFSDLDAEHVFILIWLVSGDRDGLGREAKEMADYDPRAVADLLKWGLVEFHEGWNGAGWYRLTASAWRMFEV